jgi:formate/nitrite transporter FocA (FNT family)
MWKLEVLSHTSNIKQSHFAKLKRIDFFGAIFLSASIVCGLTVLDLAGQRLPWTHPTILALFGASLVTGNIFLLVEGFWAKEPIFPLRLLLNRDVVTSYINLGFQSGAQMTMMMLVPMYFQVSAHSSVTNAGAHLMPSVMGNAVGGILTGIIIRRLVSPISLVNAKLTETAPVATNLFP